MINRERTNNQQLQVKRTAHGSEIMQFTSHFCGIGVKYSKHLSERQLACIYIFFH